MPLDNPMDGDLVIFAASSFNEMHTAAAKSERRRQHCNVHQSHEEPCQRLFIALRAESYIPPHRHLLDPKRETLIAISGLLGLIVFDDDGGVVDIILFGSEAFGGGKTIPIGMDMPPHVWHSVVTLTPTAVLFETKPGPFLTDLAKEPCAWAPSEGTPEADAYHANLLAQANDIRRAHDAKGIS